jgi:hypothetical protein
MTRDRDAASHRSHSLEGGRSPCVEAQADPDTYTARFIMTARDSDLARINGELLYFCNIGSQRLH